MTNNTNDGYEVCKPITDDAFSALLYASYTPSNGIRIRIQNKEEDYQDTGLLGTAEFDLSAEQAKMLGNKLIKWAVHNHGYGESKK